MKKVYLFLFGFVVFVPLGLISQNPAWGEWEESYYKKVLGYLPKGMQEKSYEAPFGDYALGTFGDISSYYISAIVGIVVIFGFFKIIQKGLASEKTKR